MVFALVESSTSTPVVDMFSYQQFIMPFEKDNEVYVVDIDVDYDYQCDDNDDFVALQYVQCSYQVDIEVEVDRWLEAVVVVKLVLVLLVERVDMQAAFYKNQFKFLDYKLKQ